LTQPNELQLLDWKSKYGAIHIIELEGIAIYYRSLSPIELQSYHDLSEKMPHLDWNECLYRLAVLYPEDPQFELPGSPVALANAIIDASAPVDPETGNFVMNDVREWANRVSKENGAIALAVIIANNYPSLDLIELLKMPMDYLLQLAALLEIVLGRSLFDKEENNAHTDQLKAAIEREKRKARQIRR
jgi:hypothetical protein